ncbi:hypothetical protein ACLOJK_030362 [Asimina triloba]
MIGTSTRRRPTLMLVLTWPYTCTIVLNHNLQTNFLFVTAQPTRAQTWPHPDVAFTCCAALSRLLVRCISLTPHARTISAVNLRNDDEASSAQVPTHAARVENSPPRQRWLVPYLALHDPQKAQPVKPFAWRALLSHKCRVRAGHVPNELSNAPHARHVTRPADSRRPRQRNRPTSFSLALRFRPKPPNPLPPSTLPQVEFCSLDPALSGRREGVVAMAAKLRAAEADDDDYSPLKELLVGLEGVEARFSLCFWIYLSNTVSAPATILRQVLVAPLLIFEVGDNTHFRLLVSLCLVVADFFMFLESVGVEFSSCRQLLLHFAVSEIGTFPSFYCLFMDFARLLYRLEKLIFSSSWF